MSFGKLFYAFASLLLFFSAFIFISPSLVSNDFIYPERIDSTYLAYHALTDQNDSIPDTPELSPKEVGLDYFSFTITTLDHLHLNGWYIPAVDTPANTILFIHDLNESKLLYLDQLKQFHDRGLNVCIYDLRAHGTSEGTEFTPGTPSVKDAQQLLDTIAKFQGTNKIVLMGVGLGAGIAVQTALIDSLCAGLILENPIKSLSISIDRYAYFKWRIFRFVWNPIFKRKVEALLHYPIAHLDLTQMMKNITIPVLFLTGSEDIVNFTSETLSLFQESASEKKELMMIRKAGHANMSIIGGESYYNRIAAFTNVNFPKKKKTRYKKLALAE